MVKVYAATPAAFDEPFKRKALSPWNVILTSWLLAGPIALPKTLALVIPRKEIVPLFRTMLLALLVVMLAPSKRRVELTTLKVPPVRVLPVMLATLLARKVPEVTLSAPVLLKMTPLMKVAPALDLLTMPALLTLG